MTQPAYPDSWLHTELRRRKATIAELETRLAATERHCADLQLENERLRGQLAETGAIRGLLPPVAYEAGGKIYRPADVTVVHPEARP